MSEHYRAERATSTSESIMNERAGQRLEQTPGGRILSSCCSPQIRVGGSDKLSNERALLKQSELLRYLRFGQVPLPPVEPDPEQLREHLRVVCTERTKFGHTDLPVIGRSCQF